MHVYHIIKLHHPTGLPLNAASSFQRADCCYQLTSNPHHPNERVVVTPKRGNAGLSVRVIYSLAFKHVIFSVHAARAVVDVGGSTGERGERGTKRNFFLELGQSKCDGIQQSGFDMCNSMYQ